MQSPNTKEKQIENKRNYMQTPPTPSPDNTLRTGLLCAVIAYVIWGFLPLYLKQISHASATEILSHRIVWAVFFGFIIILCRRQTKDVLAICKNKKVLFSLLLSAVVISINWGVYIWSVQVDRVLQASLGYYISPLIYAFIGHLVFKEKLRSKQILAVILACIAVLSMIVIGGELPLISLVLALSFTAYGVIRKKLNVGAVPGLFVETIWLLPLALLYMGFLNTHGSLQFLSAIPIQKTLLIFSGLITVLPLLAFAFAARRIPFATLGIIQYIGPSLQFMLALYFGEKMTAGNIIGFGFIWIAIVIFMVDTWKYNKTQSLIKAPLA